MLFLVKHIYLLATLGSAPFCKSQCFFVAKIDPRPRERLQAKQHKDFAKKSGPVRVPCRCCAGALRVPCGCLRVDLKNCCGFDCGTNRAKNTWGVDSATSLKSASWHGTFRIPPCA